jgi:hypothetical protein
LDKKTSLLALAAALLTLTGLPRIGFTADAEMEMWSCAQMGQRRPVLYLAERGSRSYIKFQGQRISATHTLDDAGHQWNFGSNAVTLSADLVASYYQGSGRDSPQGVFKCKPVN